MPGVLSDHDLYPHSSTPRSVPASALSAQDLEVSPEPQSEFQRQFAVHLASSWVTANLAPLRELPPNWDSYGAVPLDRHAAETAKKLVTELLIQRVAPPQFFPTPEGGLSIEWHEPSLEFSIELPAGARDVRGASAYFVDNAADVEWEEPLPSAMARVQEILSRLVERSDG